MTLYFPNIDAIEFAGAQTNNLLSYRYYNPKQVVLGKTMEAHCRFAVCYWHTLCWQGNDGFGEPIFMRPWQQKSDAKQIALAKVDAMFELTSKLGLPFITFHDRDVSPWLDNLSNTNNLFDEIADYIEKKMQETNIGLLWGTANLFSHRRYMAGAASNPDPNIFAYACAQVKKALSITKRLNGENYVLWGGREGYETLLNTDLKQEQEHIARFLHLLVDYKHKIGFQGTLLIEPKPCEPTKHQYDYDTATVHAFLLKYGLEKEIKVNIEGNHATLAGHTFEHEVAYACANDLFGSIDANQGDPELGWDTDQFAQAPRQLTQVFYHILKHGGFTTGGFNFDTKVRRQSCDEIDLFYGHILGVDSLACALLEAAKCIETQTLDKIITERYAGWNEALGKKIMQGEMDLEQIAKWVEDKNLEPQATSGQQERLELMMTRI